MVTNFHELYQKYAHDVHRFAYWLCGNEQDAENITSETFVCALTVANEIQTETVKGYVLTLQRISLSKESNGFRWLWVGLPIAIAVFVALRIFFGIQYWLIHRELKDSDLTIILHNLSILFLKIG